MEGKKEREPRKEKIREGGSKSLKGEGGGKEEKERKEGV